MDQQKKGSLAISVFITAFVLSNWMGIAYSQDKYPIKAIDIIITVAPGSGIDLAGRLIGSYCNKKWHVPVNAINKPGGNNVPGCLDVYKASPDGYTLLCDSLQTSSAMFVVRNLPFQIMDRSFFGAVAGAPLMLSVPSSSPYKSLDDLAEVIKRDPGNFRWASLGGASPPDYIAHQFFKAKGIDITKTKPVLTKGGAEATTLTAGGHVMLSGNTTAGTLVAFKGGMVRPLGVSGKSRHPDYPNVPTFEELGVPAIGVMQWYGISGPPKVSSHIGEIWNKVFQEMVKDQEIVKSMHNIGLIPFFLSANETKMVVLKDLEEMKKLYSQK